MDNEPEPYVPDNLRAEQSPPARKKINWPRLTAIAIATVIGAWWVARQIAEWSDPDARNRYKGQGWEYRLDEIEMRGYESVDARFDAERQLGETFLDAGREGWELVSTLPGRAQGGAGVYGTVYYTVIFKRPSVARGPPSKEEIESRSQRSRRALEAEAKAQSEKFRREIDAIKAR